VGFVQGDSRQQTSLFPVSLDDLVPAEHVCRVIEAFVGFLDLAALGFERTVPKETGRPPYDPRDLLKLYLYGYLHRVRSSRRLEAECGRNVEVMWLLDRLAPDHKTIAEFRRRNGAGLRGAGAAFVRFCREAGLVRGEWVAIDGSKFQAVASRKAVVTAEALAREKARLEERMAAYLAALDAADAEETEPAVDPVAVRRALELLRRDHAKLARAEEHLAQGNERVTVTEPEARVMKGHGPAYNVQTAVDAGHHLIIAQAVTDEATDNRSLAPMAEAASEALEKGAFNVVADTGYSNGTQAAELEARGILPHAPANRATNNQGDGTLFDRSRFTYDAAADQYTCPAGKTLRRKQLDQKRQIVIYVAQPEDCAACPIKSACTTRRRRSVSRHVHDEALTRMNARATPEAMRLRRSTVEHPFAALKYAIFEKPRFLLRGLHGAGTEMALATLVYNIKRACNVMTMAALTQRLNTG
jgi:transposase